MLRKYWLKVNGYERDMDMLWYSLNNMPKHRKEYKEEFEDLCFKGMRSNWFPCVLIGFYGYLEYDDKMKEAEKARSLFKYFSDNEKYRSIYIDDAIVTHDGIEIICRCKGNIQDYNISKIFSLCGVNAYSMRDLEDC